MKNKISFLIFFLLFVSCAKNDQHSNYQMNIYREVFADTEYNYMMKSIAIAVSDAMKENAEFRLLLKAEALKMFDGDYDILIKSIIENEVSVNNEKQQKVGKKVSVGEMLNEKLAIHLTAKKTGGTILEELIEAFPLLQIAIPVHAETWNPDTYIPTVTFLPEEFDEAVTEIVTGYDKDGNIELLDVNNEPDVPVIVISQNERINEGSPPIAWETPAAPINLSAVATGTGINLTWAMPPESGNHNTHGYYIYRKSNNQTDFFYIGQSMGAWNKSFNDNSTQPNVFYQYFVKSYFYDQISNPSNIVSIFTTGNPNPVLSVNVYQRGLNLCEVQWTNNYTGSFVRTDLFRQVVGVDNNYQLIGSFLPYVHEYFDSQVPSGRHIIYKAVQVAHNNLPSNPKYDVVRIGYRDINTPSPVYVKRIHFDDWGIESWLAGKPEFYITVANFNRPTASAYLVQSNMDFQFDKRVKNSKVFNQKKVLDWYPGVWFDMLSFSMIEYDRPSGTLKIFLGVKYNLKNGDSTNFSPSGGIQYEITFQDKGEDCGFAYYNYFDPATTIIYFPNYGARIEVSNSDY